MSSATVASAWTAVRAEPSHRAEQVSQWLCGERLRVEEEAGDWLRCVGPDGYAGWSQRGSVLALSDVEADTWERQATGYSLGTPLVSFANASGSTVPGVSVPNHLPWGARWQPLEGGELGLPGGLTAWAVDSAQVVREPSLLRAFPREGASVVRTVRRWLGAPYCWGGRTPQGVDCSGLVQAVFAVHGVRLPRDSREQANVGSRPTGDPLVDAEHGDMLFFAPDGTEITHVAIVSGDRGSGRIVHASATRGSVVEDDLTGEASRLRQMRGSVAAWTRLLE